MELDELKDKWTGHDRALNENLRLNRRLMREIYTGRARFALWRLAAVLALGSISMLVVIVFLGRFVAEYRSMPRFVWPAVVLDLMAIAALAALNAQIGLALKIDYNQPIAVIQKRLEKLRKFRIRYSQALFLTMTLTWAPIFIVFMKGVFGADIYRLFGTRWIVTNIAFGLAVLVAGIWIARRYGPRLTGSAVGQRFLRDLAGYNLNAASGFLATLAEFERDGYSLQDRSSMREYSPDE